MNNQLSLFNNSSPTPQLWQLYIDGAARSNPGPAGAGVYLLKEHDVVEKRGFYLGMKTNNQAEYLALLLGLYFARIAMREGDKLTIFSDSELLIKQLNGIYRVKDVHLKQLFQCAQGYLIHIHCTYIHIMREKNTIADKLANNGIDKKIKVPEDFVRYCEMYGIENLV